MLGLWHERTVDARLHRYLVSPRYGLVIDDGKSLARVQVKTGRLNRGVITFKTYSTHTHRNGVACKPYTDEIEFFGVFCPELCTSYLIPITDTAPLSGAIRVDPTRNGQYSRIRWAESYLLSTEPLPKLIVVGPGGVDGVTEPDSSVPS